ncbi:MAG: class I SAM-dependent methyltransferase [Candidatus Woesearchaeota archaeon]
MYDFIASGYDKLHGDEQERKLKKLLTAITLSEYEVVVDVGCATAHLSKFFSQQEYFGLDPSEKLLAQAPRGARVLCARGEEIPIPDAQADLVLSLTALHNYDDPIRGVSELARICSKTTLIGILRKSDSHDTILRAVEECFVVENVFLDAHDTLVVARVRNANV